MRSFLLCIIALFFFQGISNGQKIFGSLAINNGATVTNSKYKEVDLTLHARGASHMQISNNGSFAGARWESYATVKRGWKLYGEDGVKTVYVKFRNANYDVSDVLSATIELDRTPPQNPEVIINFGKKYVSDRGRTVLLEVSADDAVKMQISTRPDFLNSPWMPYKTQIRNFRLTSRDGRKTVYVRFQDLAGNVSKIAQSDIIVDTISPSDCKVEIQNGDRYVKKQNVKLRLHAEGAFEMQIRGAGDWQPYKEEIEFTLSPGDGEKIVFARFRDEAGNVSTVVNDRVTLDATPPRFGKIIINNGSPYTRKYNNVQLSILAEGASEMMISDNPNFTNSKWEGYTPVVPTWPVQDIDGEKVIYVKFRDNAGNVSEVISDKITLDKTAPSNPKVKITVHGSKEHSQRDISISNIKDNKVDLLLNAEGANFMMISNVNNFYGASWQLYQPKVENWELGGGSNGEKGVYVKFRDKAGNVSEIAYDKIIIDTTAPVDSKIAIDKNREYTIDKDRKVNILLFSRGASEMMLSNTSGFEGGKWEKYSETKYWTLSDEDGEKEVFVKFRDFAGNISDVVSDKIKLDRKPPYDCSIDLNKGAEKTNHPDGVVLLKVQAADAKLMQISNTADFKFSRWDGYSEYNINWRLAGNDGEKVVYVKFKDEAGNESDVFSDKILLDRTPPKEGKVVINEGNKITNNANKKVKLSLYAEGASEMLISNRFDLKEGEWEPYQTSKEWLLEGPDGLKTVYVKFKDNAGNETKTAYDRIGVDREAPKDGKMSINGGEKYCTDINGYVTLKLYATDATEMLISEFPNFKDAQWQKYEYIVQNFLLSGEDGEKTVYSMFRDAAKNETAPITAKIILDRQEPVNESITINNGNPYTNTKENRVDLKIYAEGATEMIVSNSHLFPRPAKWIPYQENLTWILRGGDGYKTIHTKFRDEAGNISSLTKATILLDTQPPTPKSIYINNRTATTESKSVRLNISALDADYMMVSNDVNFDGAYWERYKILKDWELTDGVGLKSVYVKFKDEAGNISSYKWSQITLIPVEDYDSEK